MVYLEYNEHIINSFLLDENNRLKIIVGIISWYYGWYY